MEPRNYFRKIKTDNLKLTQYIHIDKIINEKEALQMVLKKCMGP